MEKPGDTPLLNPVEPKDTFTPDSPPTRLLPAEKDSRTADDSQEEKSNDPLNVKIDVAHIEEYLNLRGSVNFLKNTLNLVALPLLILSGIGVGFVLVWAEHILVPFVISIFFSYLLQPVVDFFNRPFVRRGSPSPYGHPGSAHSYAKPGGGSPYAGSCLPFSLRGGTSRGPGGGSSSEGWYGTIEQGTSKGSSLLFAAGEEPFGTDGDQSQTHSQPLPESSAIERTSLLENEFEPVLSEEELSKEQEKGCFDDDDNNNGKRKPRKTLYDYEGRVMGISGLPAIPGLSHISIGYEHIGCPKFISVCLALILAIAVLSGLIIFFIDAVQQFEQNNWKKYEDRAIELAADFLAFLKRNFNIDGSKIFEQILKDVKVFEITTSLVVLLMDALGYTFIVFLFVLYMLFEENVPHQRIALPPLSHEQVTQPAKNSALRGISLRQQIDHQIQRYLVIKTLISAFVGFLVYLLLGPLLNVKLAHAFGVITFLANFIPNVGAIVATLIPIPILMLDPDQTGLSRVLAIMLPVGVHGIVGNFVEPKVFGDTMELHAVVVLLSLSFWFAVWGIPGAILAVPITAVMRIIVNNIDHPYARVCLMLLEGNLGETPLKSEKVK